METNEIRKCIVAGCIIIDKNKVLLIKHKKLGMWLPPGGHINSNEFPYEAAIRETIEETGLDVELMRTNKLDFKDENAKSLTLPFVITEENVNYKNGQHIHFDMVYLARVIGGELKMSDESTEIAWFSKENIVNIKTFENVRELLNGVFASDYI